METDRRIGHYLERIYSYTNRVGHRGPCRLTLKKIEDLFPSSINNLRTSNKPRSFSNKPVEKINKIIENIVPDPNINFYNGRTDPYKSQLKDIKFNTETGPLVGELHESLSKTTYEAFKCNILIILKNSF